MEIHVDLDSSVEFPYKMYLRVTNIFSEHNYEHKYIFFLILFLWIRSDELTKVINQKVIPRYLSMAQKCFWLPSLNIVNFFRTCYPRYFYLHNLLTFFIQRHFLQQFHLLNISSQSNSAFKNDVKKKLTFSVFLLSSVLVHFSH